MFGLILICWLLPKLGWAVIYTANFTEYDRMPALYAIDDYERCMLDADNIYCVVDMDLSSNSNSSLMEFILEYSEHKNEHFNHTQVHRGVCVTKSCEKFFQSDYNGTLDLNRTLERCLNDSLWRDYELQASLSTVRYCRNSNETSSIALATYLVGAIYIIIFFLNFLGSLYDVIQKRGGRKGNPYLVSFSIPRNWAKLGSSSSEESERLKVFQGLRTLLMMTFILSHTYLGIFNLYVDNPLFLEQSYDNPTNFLLLNGMVVTAIFFAMSSFLLAYNFELGTRKPGIQWGKLFSGITFRWLRLTPVYALILATVVTIMPRMGSGPLWDLIVTSEADLCRRYWWMHMLYVNNWVFRDDQCLIQTWYVAADVQLFCVGLVVCVVARSPRARKIVLSTLFVASLVIAAAVTYFLDLDAIVLQTPENFRHFYAIDRTLLYAYVLPHTNLSSCVIGLAGGFLAYHWQTTKKDFSKYRKYGWLLCVLPVLATVVVVSGAAFYMDGKPPSTALKVAYAALAKPTFQALAVIFIISSIFKIENYLRSIAEWKGFSWLGKLTYSVFLIHTSILRPLIGAQTRPIHFGVATSCLYVTTSIVLSYACAVFFYLCVEAPSNTVIKTFFKQGGRKNEDKENNLEITMIQDTYAQKTPELKTRSEV